MLSPFNNQNASLCWIHDVHHTARPTFFFASYGKKLCSAHETDCSHFLTFVEEAGYPGNFILQLLCSRHRYLASYPVSTLYDFDFQYLMDILTPMLKYDYFIIFSHYNLQFVYIGPTKREIWTGKAALYASQVDIVDLHKWLPSVSFSCTENSKHWCQHTAVLVPNNNFELVMAKCVQNMWWLTSE